MKNFSLVGTIALVLYTVPAWAQTASSKQQDQPAEIVTVVPTARQKIAIKELLDVLPETPGGTQEFSGVVDEIIKLYRGKYNAVPEKVWVEVTLHLRQDFGAGRLVEFMAPVYLSRFTDQEIKGLTAFFSSPVGKKWSRLMPETSRASYKVGDALGFLMGEQINKKLIALGYAVPTKQ